MAKKKKKFRETTIEDYYDLKVDKVDELVAALTDDNYDFGDEISMNISDCTGVDDRKNYTRFGKPKQFDPYRTDFLGKVPTWIKAVIVKWWFFGVVCWFINMGLGRLIQNDLDMLVFSGIIMGLAVELLVNPILRFMETDKKEYNDYMMFPFPFKSYWTFFTNVFYYIIVAAGSNGCYFGINELCNVINGTSGHQYLGMEPILFGVFCVIVDMVFIGIKDIIVRLVKKSKRKETADV